jgi:hypothetical protein
MTTATTLQEYYNSTNAKIESDGFTNLRPGVGSFCIYPQVDSEGMYTLMHPYDSYGPEQAFSGETTMEEVITWSRKWTYVPNTLGHGGAWKFNWASLGN